MTFYYGFVKGVLKVEKYMIVLDKAWFGIDMLPQPTDSTCGPTCLQAVYQYYGDYISLPDIIGEVKQLKSGGTLAVNLGNHALKRGYKATLYTYNLNLFDPSWFDAEEPDLLHKLGLQKRYKPQRRIQFASVAYMKFLKQGGEIKFEDLSPELIKKFLFAKQPILTGLSATYLYGSKREIGDTVTEYDDLRGLPVGHFVVLNGYSEATGMVSIADPLKNNPMNNGEQHYKVDINRLINAIMLGIVTYDANLLIIEPRDKNQ
ncbi:peptidase-C39 like family protein [Roseivirga seohaensis]|nr:peptidase-C39 like family protein [Roseivirga seohaensis]